MLIINNLSLPLDTDFTDLKPYIAKALKLNIKDIKAAKLFRKSVDARKKYDVHFCCSVLFSVKANEQNILKRYRNISIYKEEKYIWKKVKNNTVSAPVVVGFGPAGMFAALTLARAGLKPIVIERGRPVEQRTKDVKHFFESGKLNPESNVQFGEGGAGTFSDGKLSTGIKDFRCRAVLEEFALKGAEKSVLTDAKPHIGTDILSSVVKNIREEIISLGGNVLFEKKLENINVKNGILTSVTVSGENIPCENLILATGHSARDTFLMLKTNNIEMVKKPFSVGVRIEHLQKEINKALYGDFAEHPALGAADYKLAVHLDNGRGVYTFCMCPGGEVINASSESGGIAVNGMSNSHRDGVNANSAVLVGLEPEDLGEDVLSGCLLQEKIEKAAYGIAEGSVPITTVGSLCFGEQPEIKSVKPTVKPKTVFADFKDIFPDFVCESLKTGILLFDKKIKGFASSDAVLTAPETRSSSPVRILRNEDGQSPSAYGLYPTGEGAGYAGGIMSAAVDGIKAAEKIIEKLNSEEF